MRLSRASVFSEISLAIYNETKAGTITKGSERAAHAFLRCLKRAAQLNETRSAVNVFLSCDYVRARVSASSKYWYLRFIEMTIFRIAAIHCTVNIRIGTVRPNVACTSRSWSSQVNALQEFSLSAESDGVR